MGFKSACDAAAHCVPLKIIPLCAAHFRGKSWLVKEKKKCDCSLMRFRFLSASTTTTQRAANKENKMNFSAIQMSASARAANFGQLKKYSVRNSD